jgi:3-oxoadipate enol-lactonase
MWAAQVAALRDEFRCVAWDARLHGSTKDEGGLYTYWDSADDVLVLLDQLGVEQATLVGHFVRHRPDRRSRSLRSSTN